MRLKVYVLNRQFLRFRRLALRRFIYRLKTHVYVMFLIWFAVPVMRLRMAPHMFGLSARRTDIRGIPTLEIRGICLGADIPLGSCLTPNLVLLEGDFTSRTSRTTRYSGIDNYGFMTQFQRIRTLSQVTRDNGVCY